MSIKKNIPLRVASGIMLCLLVVGIFFLSSQQGDESDALSIPIAELFSNGEFNAVIHVLIRKLAHMGEFGLVSASGFVFLATFKDNAKVTAIASFLFALFYAVSDEVHQLFVPGRSGLVSDVFIDGLGALLGTLFVVIIFMIIKKKNQ